MNEAQKLGLMAKLTFALLSKISDEASQGLSASLKSAMAEDYKKLVGDNFHPVYVGKGILESLSQRAMQDPTFNFGDFFTQEENIRDFRNILSAADLFATAANNIGASNFSGFWPSTPTREEVAPIISEQTSPFATFVRDIL